MPKASSFSPLRLFTPIQLIFCFILFFLPWIELQCVVPASELKDLPKEQLEGMKKESGWDPTKPFSIYSQSGLQIATGNVSPGSDMRRYTDKMKEKMGAAGGKVDLDATSPGGKKKDEGGTAPLLFLYLLAVIGGIVVGFILGPGMPRRITLVCICLGALGVIGLQAAIGFPVEREIKKQMKDTPGMNGMGGFGGFGGGKAPAGGGKSDSKGDPKVEDMFRVSWQIPLYLTILLLLGAAGTSFLDGGGATKRRKKAYNFDEDEDDEDEEDRPRKKKRRTDDDDEDEEEDERPKKKRQQKALSLDDDEEAEADERPRKPRRDEPRKKPAGSDGPFAFDTDEPPRKKKPRRDDDDEEDERPHKKKRRDDD